MKVYTNTFDLTKPVPMQFQVPKYSDFAIGIKVVNNGEAVDADITLQADGQTFVAEEEKIAGFTIYNTSSTNVGSVKYKITCNGQIFNLTEIVVDTTVFEKKNSDVNTEYVVIIGNIDNNGVLNRSALSDIVEVSAYALQGAFAGHEEITNVGFQNMTTIGEYGMASAFNDCSSLATVDMSKLSSVLSNGLDGTFNGCTSLEIVLFKYSDAIPAITETTFANTNDTYKIIVPDALYDSWISSANWADISSHISQVSSYAAIMTNYGGSDSIED